MIPSARREFDSPFWIAFILWLCAQLAALILSGARIGLWARAPRPTEQLALPILLVFQVGVSSLIFPHLLRNWRQAILVIASAWPPAQLASYLADASANAMVHGEVYVCIWLITLHLWRRAIPKPRDQLSLIAAASLLSIGGPILWYLRVDFITDSISLNSNLFAALGPLCGAIAQCSASSSAASWIEITLIFLFAAFILMGKLIIARRSQQVSTEI
jgi:hypothetical protein